MVHVRKLCSMQGLRWLRSGAVVRQQCRAAPLRIANSGRAPKGNEAYSCAGCTQDDILSMVRVRKLCSMQGLRWLRSRAVARQQCRAAPLCIANIGCVQNVVEGYSFAVCTHNDILAWCVRANFVRCKGCAVCGAVARQQWRAHQLRIANSGRAQKVVEAYNTRRMTS